MIFKKWTFTLLAASCVVFGESQNLNLVEGDITSTPSDSRSVNFIDLNKDGWEDIFISNGLQGGQADMLYINNGDGTFSSVEGPITQANNPSDGASFADINNDGQPDGMVVSWYGAPDLLFLNNGEGILEEVPESGIAAGSFAETAIFFDYNEDGWLDLYVTNSGGNKKNFLYENDQDGSFTLVTDHTLVQAAKLSRGVMAGDFDGDGHQDLFVVNEGNATNDYYVGLGSGAFEKREDVVLAELSVSSMTTSWGDIDNDGDLDVFIGNAGYFSPRLNQLYLNNGNHQYTLADNSGITESNCTFGSAFADYDNDGDLDLAIANGFCSTGLANILYENQGDGTFVNISDQLSQNGNTCSFGLAWGDVNNDGFVDLMIANCKNNSLDGQNSNALYLNTPNDNHWLQVKLEAFALNTSAIGARLRAKAIIDGEAVWQMRDIQAQSGYAGQNSLTVHFGLGDATQVDSLEIYWPSGEIQLLENIGVDEVLSLVEMPTLTTSPVPSEDFRLKVFPNPVLSDSARLQFSIAAMSKAQAARILLVNALGQICYQTEASIPEGTSNGQVRLPSHLPKGSYHMVVQLEERQQLTAAFYIQ